jgi:hypothetical protein
MLRVAIAPSQLQNPLTTTAWVPKTTISLSESISMAARRPSAPVFSPKTRKHHTANAKLITPPFLLCRFKKYLVESLLGDADEFAQDGTPYFEVIKPPYICKKSLLIYLCFVRIVRSG